MKTSILVAVDRSPCSAAMLSRLAQFPFSEPPDLTLAHVCPVPDMHALGEDIPRAIQRVIERSRSEGWELLAESENECRSWAGRTRTRLLSGHAAEELVQAARKDDVDLIAIGSHGLGRTGRFLLGSVSDQVARHAHCSVLVIRPEVAGDPEHFPARILVADDTSLVAARAVEHLAAKPLGESRHVELLRVIETGFNPQKLSGDLPISGGEAQALRMQKELVRENLERAQHILQKATPHVSFRVYESNNVAEAILEAAESSDAELIVLGNTGKSGWERLLMGSVSIRVLHHAPCSVWIERVPVTDRQDKSIPIASGNDTSRKEHGS